MLSATIEEGDEHSLTFPLYTSPKIDGIRCICHPELGPVSRSLKPIPNEYIRQFLSHPLLKGLDGELVVNYQEGEKVNFQGVYSGVMTSSGRPDFTYLVFDYVSQVLPYHDRNRKIGKILEEYSVLNNTSESLRILQVTQLQVDSWKEVLSRESYYLDLGYEGLMVRSISAPYKFGRSTLKQQYLMKLKRFKDTEAVVVGIEPLMRNMNEAVINELGLQERSSHKGNKVADELMGRLEVEHPEFGRFFVGSGFDETLRRKIWNNPQQYIGRLVTIKYLTHGMKEGGKPRHPIFKSFRED